MEEALVLQDLEDLAAALDVEIRYEELEGPGGLCRYAGRTCLIISRSLSLAERIHLISRNLARFPLADVYLRPHVRELVEHYCGDDAPP